MSISLADKVNSFDEFKEWYLKIVDDFHYDSDEDRKARDVLLGILAQKHKRYDLERILINLQATIHLKKNILVYGCGPSLERTVKEIMSKK